MNTYLIAVCEIQVPSTYILKINAKSYSDCQDKIMEKFSAYSSSLDWYDFLEDLDKQDILIGQITDIEEL